MKLIIQNNQIIGTTTADDPNGYALIDPPADWDGQIETITFDAATHTATYDLSAFKNKRKAEIKTETAQQIEALNWRIERAQEQDRLGLPGELLQTVLLEREAIRRAGNRCEAAIAAATTIDAVHAVAFAITPADQATSNRLTRLDFLRRFTEAEMQAIVTAADTNAMLKAALLKWQTAEGIVLTDPETIAGVQALEIAGLLAAGRAAQVLAQTAPVTG